jgi:hypothetical protein
MTIDMLGKSGSMDVTSTVKTITSALTENNIRTDVVSIRKRHPENFIDSPVVNNSWRDLLGTLKQFVVIGGILFNLFVICNPMRSAQSDRVMTVMSLKVFG